MDQYAYAPVFSGEWKQHEVWDGTYTFRDLLDWHEMAQVKAENERRYRIWSEANRGQ
ncbi:DUF6889 family protein [Macellibacteroides fermentans]|uniref:DUF6889 family protein n=1 Tax=Macellibacteroides fermentans TaxID=879969 RepID=UPI00406CC245